MNKKVNQQEYQNILNQEQITTLYHFTDRDNLASIIKNGGLYSWKDCEEKGISIAKPGGNDTSHSLDSRDGLQNYVRTSFTKHHPMMYVGMNFGRISNPVILEIDPEVVFWEDTLYSDRNATRNGAQVGGNLDDFKAIHFKTVKGQYKFDLDPDEQPYFQAEVMVKHFIPLKYIRNIGNFGISIPSQPLVLQAKTAYAAQITRERPTAFVFLVDQSVSMNRKTSVNGESISMAEAVARIVNNQINELVLRCIKTNETRHYYDIAVIGYGEDVYSGWSGTLSGRDFVSPEELKDNPLKTITTMEEKRTRKGTVMKEVKKVQWMEARCDGSWTHMHAAFEKAKDLIGTWMEKHHDKDCYPPTIINITDGMFNGTTQEDMVQVSNELKSMFTNDGNVILFNIHIIPDNQEGVVFPVSKLELHDDRYGNILYDMSSLLPERYNQPISDMRGDSSQERHVAMAINADMNTLIQLMDIGTPTNINQNL
jgi:hypothetical protein